MEPLEKYSWLDEALSSSERAIGFMDLSTLQPTSWLHFQPLIADEWLKWFWKIIEARKQQNIPYERIAQVFEPDLCREHLMQFVLTDLKSAHWPLEKRLAVTDFFYETLKAQMPQGDLFGIEGTTRRHSTSEVGQIMNGHFEIGTPLLARELGKLYNAAYNLGAALYLDFYMGKAIENWGPYQLPDGKILVIKEMRYLRPIELWPNINSPYEKIDWYAVYEKVKFSTDLIACHTQYEGDVLNGLKKWMLVADGKPVTDVTEIRRITDTIAAMSAKQWTVLTSLPEPELIEKAVRIRCYCFKQICELLGLDWRPPEVLLNAVKGKTLAEGWAIWQHPTNEVEYRRYWRNIWDPRKDFYPESVL